MRVPIRKGEILRQTKQDDGPLYLTQEGIDRLKHTAARIERELPDLIEEVRRTGEYGDFSENVEYQAAKGAMRRARNRLLGIEEKLKRAVLIEKRDPSAGVGLGSSVTVEADGARRVFDIVGPHEADPLRHRISHLSPLGQTLMGKRPGGVAVVATPRGEMHYTIIDVT